MTYIIYDFETSGRSARFDQILQAGFIIYDKQFNQIEELNIRSRINSDIVPSLGALKVNKLKISDVLCQGISYYQMILEIEKFLKKYKNSFYLGFNSINFDEEFFRQAFWEHFFFPYLTNTQGNKRGDLLNFVTMVHAFRKDNVCVEKNDEGKLTFRLESLAKANCFNIKDSHEAIADVQATMLLMNLLVKKNRDFLELFAENSNSKNVEKKIISNQVFTLHNYMFSSHRIYLVKHLIKHPVYNNQLIGFDLKYDCSELINYTRDELKEIYKNKSFFRKIRINKQPSILDKSFARNIPPYSDMSEDEINLKNNQLNDTNFCENLKSLLELEALEKIENQSQELQQEEETIYSKNLNYKDSIIMNHFHNEKWEEKWLYAEKFNDSRLRFFAAKHIYRNSPECLPNKIFKHLHNKISDRLNSLKKERYFTIPQAMEEADNYSLEIEELNNEKFFKEQVDQYNIYINFLNDYYNNTNAKPQRFDHNLSKILFGVSS